LDHVCAGIVITGPRFWSGYGSMGGQGWHMECRYGGLMFRSSGVAAGSCRLSGWWGWFI